MRLITLVLLLLLFGCGASEGDAPDAPGTRVDGPAADATAIDAVGAIDAVVSTCVLPATITMAPEDAPFEGGYEAFFNHAPASAFAGAEPDNCTLTTDVAPGQPLLLAVFDHFGSTSGDFWVMPISISGWTIIQSSHGTMSGTALRGLPNNTQIEVRLQHATTGRTVEVTFLLSHALTSLTIVDLVVLS
jgi:hypothetical protein